MSDLLLNTDIGNIVTEKAIEYFIKHGIENTNKLLKEGYEKIECIVKKKFDRKQYDYFKEKFDLDISEKRVLTAIQHNLQTSSKWCDEVNFASAISSKALKKIFVDIDLYLSPLKYRFDDEEQTPIIASKSVVNDFCRNKLIYGGAGAGKTTLVKKIYSDFGNNKLNDAFSCPIMIRFRELEYENLILYKMGLFKILIDLFGIQFSLPNKFMSTLFDDYYTIMKQVVISFINDCRILIIADGFDEIPDVSLRRMIEREFYELALSLTDGKFILTSRSNEFMTKLNNTDTYEICPLNDSQIKLLVHKWIKKKDQAEDFLEKIRHTPFYDTAMRPLTLSHLCAIYERKKTIPQKPRYIYEFVIGLLLEKWDIERNIIRPSQYADFYVEKKKEFLSHLSFYLTYHFNKSVFNQDDIRKCYNQIYISHNLPKSQAKKVIIELESHTGLLLQTGQNHFQFSHKSLQEYLVARYLNSLPQIPEVNVVNSLPNEIAIAICLSSFPNYYFTYFEHNYRYFNEEFWPTLFTRLVDEKPDFCNDARVVTFFIHHIYKEKKLIFYETFKELLESTNLKSTIKSFYEKYQLVGDYGVEKVYVLKDMSTALQKRDYLPAKLICRKELYLLIQDYVAV